MINFLQKKYSLIKVIALLLGLTFTTLSIVGQNNKNSITENEAKTISLDKLKHHTRNEIKKFSCELIEENELEWVFGYKNADESPHPGSGWIVIIEKKTKKIRIIGGM